MKKLFSRVAGVCLLAASSLLAQTTHNGSLTVLGNFDSSQGISSKPFTSVTSDPSGTCSNAGWTQLNISSGAQSGDISTCLNGQWALVGGPGLISYTPTFTGGVQAPLSGMITANVLYGDSFGMSPLNATNDAQLQAAFNVAFSFSNTGQANPTKILVPCGTYPFASQIQPPPYVWLEGCSVGDSKQLVGPNGNGTVLQETSAFASKVFPDNMLVFMGGKGALTPEYFRIHLQNLTLDANGYGGGLMIGDCQEMCSADRIQIDNFKNYGFFDWGANNNGNSALINTPWGLPANFQGSANDGPYSNFEFYPYGAATTTTVPIVLANVASLRAFENFTVATDNPTQNNGANTPAVCGLAWGSNGVLRSGHCEGPSDGFTIGPWGGAAYQYGNGATNWTVDNIQYSTPQIATGCAIRLQQPKGVTVTTARGGQTDVICNDQAGYHTPANFYTVDYNIATNFFPVISSRDGLNLDSPITTTNTITANQVVAGNLKIESNNPCVAIQLAVGPGYPYQQTCVNGNGDMIWTAAGGSSGDVYYQGSQNLAMGVGVNKSGLNLSSPEAASNNVMSLIGNNLFYQGSTNQFSTSGNGNNDANGIIMDLSSIRLVGNGAVAPNTLLTPATVNGSAWSIAQFNNNGTSLFGNSGVSGAVSTFTNSSGSCTINPTATALTCSSDERLKKNITALSGGLQVVQALNPVQYNWKTEADSTMKHDGFVAQELQKVLPASVVSDRSGYLQIAPDTIIPYLVDSIKTLQSEVDQLKAQLAQKH